MRCARSKQTLIITFIPTLNNSARTNHVRNKQTTYNHPPIRNVNNTLCSNNKHLFANAVRRRSIGKSLKALTTIDHLLIEGHFLATVLHKEELFITLFLFKESNHRSSSSNYKFHWIIGNVSKNFLSGLEYLLLVCRHVDTLNVYG